MKLKLKDLHSKAMGLIEAKAKEGNGQAIARIAEIANHVQDIQHQLDHIESNEIPQIEDALNAYTLGQEPDLPLKPSTVTTVGDKIRLRVTFDWTRLGKPGGKESICCKQSSDTMRKWAERLSEALGPTVLQKLAQFQISRGPMVSMDPHKDFKNNKHGSIYAHQPIGNSDYYILTHSSTGEKVTDIEKACQKALHLPLGAVIAEQTYDTYETN